MAISWTKTSLILRTIRFLRDGSLERLDDLNLLGVLPRPLCF